MLMGVSARHTRRILAAYLAKGASALDDATGSVVSVSIWQLALARRSRALLPRMESSKSPSHSSTARLLMMTKLDARCRPRSSRMSRLGGQEGSEGAVCRVVHPGQCHGLEEVVGVAEADGMSGADGRVAQGLSEEALADTARSRAMVSTTVWRLRPTMLYRCHNPWHASSVVVTNWLSVMSDPGVASSPAASRARAREAVSTRSRVPSSRHFRMYRQSDAVNLNRQP